MAEGETKKTITTKMYVSEAQASAAKRVELALQGFVLATGAAPDDCEAVYDQSARLVAIRLKDHTDQSRPSLNHDP